MINSKDRLQWFIDRIGKRIYRNDVMCTCAACEGVYQEGITILDDTHAHWLSDVEIMYNTDGTPLKYFDTLQEVQDFELLLAQKGL